MYRIFIMSFFLLLLMANANASDDVTFLKCVRKVSQSWKLLQDEYVQLLDVVKDYRSKGFDVSLAACKKLKSDSKLRNKQDHDVVHEIFQDYIYRKVGQKPEYYNPGAIVASFALPKNHCWLGGGRADVVALLGLGAGAALGHCKSSDGRRWLVLRAEASVNVGLGADVLVTIAEAEYDYAPGDWIYLNTNNRVMIGGLGIAGMVDEWTDYEPWYGAIGVGAGLHYGAVADMTVKLVPLGSNFNELKEKL